MSVAALPMVGEIATPLSPLEIYEALQGEPLSFFLDSGMSHQRLGRYSFVGADPFLVFRSKGRQLEIEEGGEIRVMEGNPFDVLQQLLRRYQLPRLEGFPPFLGGAAGYFAYDLGEHLEVLPSRSRDDLGLPDCYLGFYDTVVAIDHQAGRTYLCSSGLPETEARRAERRAAGRWEQVMERLEQRYRTVDNRAAVGPGSGMLPAGTVHSNFTREEYCQAVRRAKEYIAAGDIYQVNLSQRLWAETQLTPLELYRRLRRINPAPFAAFLDLEGVKVASASPERFLKVTGRQVETRPIKGTRPRGRDPESDRRLREELWNSEKDRAELVMIVDLERNDLGRVCEYGSVRVPELFCLEEYATVFHLVSTVVGTLRPGLDVVDLLKASFPGGSITGAPKIRAMEIIDELEGIKRGIYTGAIGYLSFSGDADLNIVIRTFVLVGNRAYFQVGGGIVADSDPEAEYQETLDKARALIQALHAS